LSPRGRGAKRPGFESRLVAVLRLLALGLLFLAVWVGGSGLTPDAGSPVASPSPAWIDACPSSLGGGADDGSPVWEDQPVVAPRKKAWEDALGGRAAARPHIQARLRGWPDRTLIDPATLPAGGRPLLERIARDTWRGLDALSDRESGLPIDHVRVARESTALADAEIGDYANVTNIGLYLVDLVAARDLGFLTPEETLERTKQILTTLEGLESEQGLLFNYYDTTSLERTSNFLSFVDLSWLVAGLITTRQAMPELADRASLLIERTRLGFFYDPDRGLMSHGYFTNRRARSRYHYGILYTEARLGVLLAIGKGEIPREAWYRMVRVFPPSCTGQTLVPEGVQRRVVGGQEVLTGWYAWRGLRYVPSWGGSMFEALMPVLVLDERTYAPRSLGENDRVHATVQETYARAELGYPVWGLSPSARPAGAYGEFGARVLGSRGYPAGVVTPHATALALAVAPERATEGLRALVDRYPLYGEYGFYDAVAPMSGEVAYQYLALDQSMLFLAIANHLTGGSLRTRFGADPIVAAIVPLLGEETFFE
jgi:hypothetical protein